MVKYGKEYGINTLLGSSGITPSSFPRHFGINGALTLKSSRKFVFHVAAEKEVYWCKIARSMRLIDVMKSI